jgi:hypothetical protein
MESHFKKVYREVRSILTEPDKTLFILHTSIGALTISRLRCEEDLGYIFFEGRDENNKWRFVGFSEAQISSFAFELKPRSAEVKAIGFQPDTSEEVSES